MVNLKFYGDRTSAKMFVSTLVKFDDGCRTFVPSTRTLLNTAVKEALFERQQQFHGHADWIDFYNNAMGAHKT